MVKIIQFEQKRISLDSCLPNLKGKSNQFKSLPTQKALKA